MARSEVKYGVQRLPGNIKILANVPWIRRIALAVAVITALPFMLTLYYAVVPPPISMLMVWRLFEGRGMDYRWTPLANISPDLSSAVVTAEDAQFCLHHGVDWTAMQNAVEDAVSGDEEASRGASTIAMQTAKNLFLWEGRSVLRKIFEVPLAMWIDAIWSKKRQIEIYLNIAEWGPGIYGAEAAAQKHFHRPAAKLTRQQAALLASVLPNPIKRHAGRPSGFVQRKALVIMSRMPAMGSLLGCIHQ